METVKRMTNVLEPESTQPNNWNEYPATNYPTNMPWGPYAPYTPWATTPWNNTPWGTQTPWMGTNWNKPYSSTPWETYPNSNYPATPYTGYNKPYGTPWYNNSYGYNTSPWGNTVNMYENTKSYHIDLAVPNMTKDQCYCRVENGMLVVTGYTKTTGSKGEVCFTRTFPMPGNVDTSKITAKCTNGILYLSLTKKTGKAANEIPVS